MPRFPSVARNDEGRGKALLRRRTRAKLEKAPLYLLLTDEGRGNNYLLVFLAEEECGLPRFARNDGCEVTGLPRFLSVARNDEKRGKARLRVGTRVRFLSGGRQGVGTRVRFLSGRSARGRDKDAIFVGKLVRGRDKGAIFVGKLVRGRDKGAIFIGKVERGRDEEEGGLL